MLFMMAGTSGEQFNSNRNYRCWLAETFDDQETADDELAGNLDGNDNIIQQSIQDFPVSLEPFEPFIGMEFESAEDAREFYELYGRRMGFTIRNNRTRRSLKDNSIIGREFVCSKEGFRGGKSPKGENRVFQSRPITREGCNAMLRIAAKDGGKWVIYGFIKEHNHDLNPSKIPPRRSHRIAFSEEYIMDKQSVHGFDSNESDLDLQGEAYECERIEDELQDNLDFCVDEDDKTSVQCIELAVNAEGLEPCVGMEFNSRDEAREFYISYGRCTGFTVRIHHNRRSRVNNQVIGQDFVCSKEGFRAKKYVHRKDRILPPPPITREGCGAMIRLALKGGKWVVTKFVKEHTHKLMSPSKVPWRGSGKQLISEDEKDKRIRELSLELYNERQKCKRRCAVYEEQLNMILQDLEKHTEHVSKKVDDVVKSIREIEEEHSDDSNSE
ncbi:hypothetical protein NC651_018873 [Populus alba x Populus x berolinensis]|nr:hypothetical protein NC651_018873 [Populus alba x Populus x berolinensis]